MFVTYNYVVAGETYTSQNIGMGIRHWTLRPLGKMDWEKSVASGETPVVYYYSRNPSIAVLYRGFDILATIAFLLCGWCMVSFSKWIDSHATAT